MSRITSLSLVFIFGIPVACSSTPTPQNEEPRPQDAAAVPDAPPSNDASTATADASAPVDGGKPVCQKAYETLGMPCLTANNTVCPTGGECYGALLRNVCGPRQRKCNPSAPNCAAGQACLQLRADSSEEGVCLTADERVCFCGNIGVSLRPPACPIYDEERPGTGDICACPGGAEACVSMSGVGPCKPGLACIRGGCRGKPCMKDEECAASEICLAYADFDGTILGRACAPRTR
jgi:hypothetical protein